MKTFNQTIDNGINYSVELENNNKAVNCPIHTANYEFEKFNDSINFIESKLDEYGYFATIRAKEAINTYDEMINKPNADLRIIRLSFEQIEHFKNICLKKNGYWYKYIGKNENGAVIYQLGYNKTTLGFIRSLKQFDGHFGVLLWSRTEKRIGDNIFSNEKTVLKAIGVYKKFNESFYKIANRLKDDSIKSYKAYSVLKKKDSIKFYTVLNDNMTLNKSDRDLLRYIDKMGGKKSFECIIEDAEERLEEVKDILDSIYEYGDLTEFLHEVNDLEIEKKELEGLLSSASEEDNSMSSITDFGDYQW